MNRLPSIQKLGFLDPWKQRNQLFYSLDEVRYNRESMTGQEKKKIEELAREARQEGGLAYFKKVDQTVDAQTQQEKKELIEDLTEFEAKTHLSQAKAIKKVQECKSPWELKELQEKLKKSGLEYLDNENNPSKPQGLLQKSMAYVPVHEAEREILKAKENTFRKFLQSLPATAPQGEDSIASVIMNFDKFIEPRLKFRSELKGQTKFVQEMFFLELGASTDPFASETSILAKVKERVKGLENEPQALQKEYRKKVTAKEDPTKALAEVREEFKKRQDAYVAQLDPTLFGGKLIQTPQGPMRAARWEYMQWFKNDLKDFAHMDRMFEALKSSELPKRRAAYAKRDELLKHLPEDKAAVLREKTDEMRFHSLKAYLKDLEALSGKESAHALEYMAEIEAAEAEGMALFTPEEKARLKEEILNDSPKIQEVELTLLKEKVIPNRTAVIQEFNALPDYVKLGQKAKFQKMSFDQKKAFLKKVNTTQLKSDPNPFAKLDEVSSQGGVDRKARDKGMLRMLRSEEGRKFLQERTQKEAAAKSAQVIAEVTKRTGSWVKQLEEKDLTQMEGRMQEDAHFGLHGYNDQVWKAGFDNHLAKNDRDQFYGNTFVMDMKLRNAGYDRSSGGKEIKELQVIDHNDWMSGDESMLDSLDDAIYGRALFLGEDGKDELDMRTEGRKAWELNKQKLIQALIHMLGLEGASKEVIDELTYATMEINDAFSDADEFYGTEESANNSSHFEDEEYQAAA